LGSGQQVRSYQEGENEDRARDSAGFGKKDIRPWLATRRGENSRSESIETEMCSISSEGSGSVKAGDWWSSVTFGPEEGGL